MPDCKYKIMKFFFSSGRERRYCLIKKKFVGQSDCGIGCEMRREK